MADPISLTLADHGSAFTLAEYLAADVELGFRYELVEGRVEVFPFPTVAHELLRNWVNDDLRDYEERDGAAIDRVMGCRPCVWIAPDGDRTSVLQPDGLAYDDFPFHIPMGQRQWRDVSPCLVLEVVNPDHPDKDLVRNPRLYLQVPSIREYWVLDTREGAKHPSLIVFRRRGKRWAKPLTIPPRATYTTPMLPGFALVVDPKW